MNPISEATPMDFLARANLLIDRGIPVIPVQPREKRCTLPAWNKKATTNVAELGAVSPQCNTGAVAIPDGVCIFDADSPEIIARIERETGQTFPKTFSVRGSKPSPAGHYYLKQTDRSRRLGNRELNLRDEKGQDDKDENGKTKRVFDFQQKNKYVVGPGSIHPSGKTYEVVDDSPIVEIPDWLCDWMEQATTRSTAPSSDSRKQTSGLSVSAVATRILTRDLSKNTEEENRKLSQSMGFEHRHPADEKFAIWLAKYSGISAEEQREMFTKYKLHESRDGAYVTSTLAKAAGYGSGAGRHLETVLASDVRTKTIQWLWKHRLAAGMLNIFSGNPDQCKSLMICDIVARASTGSSWLDGAENTAGPVRVLMLVSEDTCNDVLVPRLKAAGADLEKIEIVTHVKTEQDSQREFSIATDIEILRKKLKDQPGIGLITLDPFSAYFGSEKKLNDEQMVRAVTKPLKDLAEETNVTILDNSHLNKTIGISAIQKVIGSMAVVATHRMGWAFASADNENDKSEREMLPLKHNVAPELSGIRFRVKAVPVLLDDGSDSSQPKIEYVGKSAAHIDEKLSMSGPERSARKACIEIIEDALIDGDWHNAQRIINEACEKCRCSESTVKSACRDLNVEKRKPGKVWQWKLSEQMDISHADEPLEAGVPF